MPHWKSSLSKAPRFPRESGASAHADLLESGTPNTPGIAGLLAGIQYIKQEEMDKIHQHEQRLCRMLMDGLQAIPQVELYGPDEIRRKTAVVSFNIKGMDCGELSMGLDHYYGIVSRSGLHCAPLAHQTIGSMILEPAS